MVKRSNYLARLILVAGYLGLARQFAPQPAFLMGFLLLGTLLFYLLFMQLSKRERMTGRPLFFRLVFDILMLTGYVYLTDDAHSFLLVGYAGIVVFRSVTTDPIHGRAAVICSVLILGSLFTILGTGLLEPVDVLGGAASRRAWFEYVLALTAVGAISMLANEFINPLFREADRARARAEQESHESRVDLVLSEKARHELQTYSDFARKLNSNQSFDQTVDQIFEYISENFSMEGTVLYLVDREKGVFFPHRLRMPPEAPAENIEFMQSWNIPFSEEGGFHWHAVRRGKPIYLPHIKESNIEVDKIGVQKLKLKSVLMVPLIVQNEVFGIIDFTNYNKKLNLTREDIKSITLFCEQIAGAIRSSQLVHHAQEAWRRMVESRAEIERLNEISRRINSITNLDEILETIFAFIKDQFQIEGIWLQFIDRDNQELYTYKSTRPPGITEEQLRHIRALRVPLREEGGLAYRVYERRRPFYMSRTPKRFLTELDRRNARQLGIESALYMPLVINNECVAIISFTQFHKKMKLSQKEIDGLARFCEQIAGAINNSHLHTETEFSRIIAEEHLGEITKLKGQQDLDYFLTSQLIEPLAGIHLKSETVTIDQFSLQKKNFPYKVWHCEIGGDINMAHSISWDNRPYTVFMNADAMGKSIQGAGGILVLGSAFRIIIDRTEKTKYRYPEQWLKNTYQELDRIFETFDGGMYITAFLGMIDDTTGWMYWVNIEHPPPVLYRSQKATTLDARFRLNKLGFTLGKSVAAVNMMQLKTGDSIFLGSDGREDVVLHGTVDVMTGEGEFNRDDDFYAHMIEKSGGDLKETFAAIREAGQITDDISMLKITYENDNALPGDILTPEAAELLAHDAGEMILSGRYPDAIALLRRDMERILQVNTPLDAEFGVRYDMVAEPYVQAMLASGDHERALSTALAYSSLNPGFTPVLVLGARAAGALGRMDLSADLGERVFLREPALRENLIMLIETHIRMRNLNRARYLLKQLAALEDTDAALTELKDKLEEARANLQHQGDSDRRKHTDRRQANDRRQGQGRRDSDRT